MEIGAASYGWDSLAGVSRFDPATERFTNYRPGPDESASLAYSVSAIHRDRSGTLWFGTWGGILSRFDEKTNTFVHYTPTGMTPASSKAAASAPFTRTAQEHCGWPRTGPVPVRPEDRGLHALHGEHGLPSNDLMGILEDTAGRLWISSKKGMSRFDPQTGTFRNYDVSDGLRGNDFSRSCYQRGRTERCSSAATRGLPRSSPKTSATILTCRLS